MNRLQRYLQLRHSTGRRPNSVGPRNNVVRFHDYHPERMPCHHGDRAVATSSEPHRHRAAMLTVAAVAVSCVAWWLQMGTLYTTGVGERRTIPLPDGSTLVMNTRSDLRVQFSADQRDINLIAGEVAFTVARDPSRPFTVHTRRTRIEAPGPQFSVRLGDNGTTITVSQGSVKVFANPSLWASGLSWARTPAVPTAQPSQGFAVSAGQQARVPRERSGVANFDIASRRLSAEELERQSAWVDGQVAFQEQPLEEVVREFNRYNWCQLRIIDPALRQLRVGGRFKNTHIDEFVTDLNRAFGIQALWVADRKSHDQIIELRRAQRGTP